jgi:flagellar hook-associated protein 1
MGLFAIINSATQSLLNVQTQINTVSDNVGNANTPNYNARTATTIEEDPVNGTDRVVITRAVNSTLQQEVLGQTSASGQANFVNNIYTQLEQLDGAANGTPTLSAALQTFVDAVKNFQATPEDQSAQQQVIQSGQNFATSIQSIAAGVEQIADQVTSQTNSDVSTLNTTLSSIATLNTQIVTAQATGQPTSALEDTRDAAIAQVATFVPVQLQQNPNGSTYLSTPSGVQLVGNAANNFAYSTTNNTIYSTTDPAQTPLNTAFSSGQISAELSTLDTSAAGVASQTPSQAPLQKMRDQLNALVDLFVNPVSAGTPTAIQAGYDDATPVNTGELATGLFTLPTGGPANSERFTFQVNANLLNGTNTLKQSAASPLLSALVTANQTFSAGGVSLTNASVNNVTDAISANETARAQQAQTNQQSASTALTTTQTTFNNATGVNVDQQLAQLIVLQNSYGASAKVISVVDQLLTLLQGIMPATG